MPLALAFFANKVDINIDGTNQFQKCLSRSSIIHGWTRGLENKGAAKQKGGPPYFFRTPPRGGVRKKKWGAKGKGGARTPRTPPEYASDYWY